MVYTLSTAVAAIFAGVTGGVYLAFSVMVMPSLRRRPPAEAIATMRTVNELAVRAPFMTIFFGGAVTATAVIVAQFFGDEPTGFEPIRFSGATFALASFVVTLVFNVPRNNALAHDSGRGAANAWQAFDLPWSTANHVRGVLAIIGAVMLTATLAH